MSASDLGTIRHGFARSGPDVPQRLRVRVRPIVAPTRRPDRRRVPVGPAADCWTVRRTDDGTYRADSAWPPPDPAPITTIAWRIAHVGDFLSRHPLRTIAFGCETAGVSSEHPHDAAGARSFLAAGVAAWTRDLESIDDEHLAQPMGAGAGHYADDPVAGFVLHIHTEFVHHSAEVALLRDLYPRRSARARAQRPFHSGGAPFAAARMPSAASSVIRRHLAHGLAEADRLDRRQVLRRAPPPPWSPARRAAPPARAGRRVGAPRPSASSWGTTQPASPISLARAASMRSPVSSSSIAYCQLMSLRQPDGADDGRARRGGPRESRTRPARWR